MANTKRQLTKEVAGDGLWDLSDPFDLCFQQPADVSTPGPASKIAKKSKSQQRKEQRQALYKERREARRQHQEGQLSDNW